MSGPWDRPPSSNPDDDRDWPSEDLEPRSSADRPVEPWSADDPWQERRDPSPGWDEWPPQAPPADEYALEEPEPPASDPWAESWDEDVPGIPTSPQQLDRDTAEPRSFEPEPMPTFEAAPAQADPEPRPAPEPLAEAEPRDAPRIEPWSPDPDPWGASWTVSPPEPEPVTEPEPVVEAPPPGEPPGTASAEEPAVVDEPQEPAPDTPEIPPIRVPEELPPAEDAASEADEADTTWEPDLWAEPDGEAEPEGEADDVAAAAAVGAAATAPTPPAEPETVARPEPESQPTKDGDSSRGREAAAVGALAASRLEVESPPESPWPERVDPTEVLPTSWAAPAPAPADGDGVEPSTGEVRTTLGRSEPDLDEEVVEEPTTAEQAVPWLIGVILLLAGMVIVLLALIFAGDASLGGGADATPSPTIAVAIVPNSTDEPSASADPSPTARPSPSPSARASAEPSPSAAAVPEYGALEMVYQGRSAPLEPIYLLRRDFTEEGDPEVLAQDANLNVQRFAWSADGTRGAFLYQDLLVGIDPGVDVHQLSDGISAITFGDDPETVYAVRVRSDGGNDVASILAVNQAGGDERQLDRVSYPRPADDGRAGLAEAQFLDEGGPIRLYWMHDDTLLLWVQGAGAWTIDPARGDAAPAENDRKPLLWAPEGERRIGFEVKGDRTAMHLVDRSGDELATATVEGRVSHLRWSPRGDQVVFTVGRSTRNGGVLQDLFLWNLGQGEDPAPMQITNTGAAFGAEWLGSQSRWQED